MPRQPRQFEVGAIFHIFSRGVEKRKIFLKTQDYSRFILALEFFNDKNNNHIWDILFREYKNSPTPVGSDPTGVGLFGSRLKEFRDKKKKPLVEILAFALMPNHYHLILREIIPGGISSFMQRLGGYSTYFNKQYDRVGPLFQGRYKSVQIKDDIQLVNIFNYVHTNPVGLIEPNWKDLKVKNKNRALWYLKKYRWSSYQDYTGKEIYAHVIESRFYLDFFGDKKTCNKAIEDWIGFKAENADVDKIKLEQ